MENLDNTSGRSANYSESEKQLLIKLCNKYKHIIESKKTDAVSAKEKTQTWEKICKQFNAVCGGPVRSVKQLKEKYKLVKKKLRQNYSDNLKYVKGTGGGPYKPPPSPKTEEEKELIETVRLSIQGITNVCDSDGRSGVTGIPCEEIQISNQGDEVEEVIDVNWSSSSSRLWQTPKHPALKRNDHMENIALYSGDEIAQNPKANLDNNDNYQMDHNINIETESDDYREITEDATKYNNSETPKQSSANGTMKNWTNRRRPVLPKKKTTSSAGTTFELAAKKKIDLIAVQKIVAENKIEQDKKEHEFRMEILKIQKENELLKQENESIKKNILKEGKLTFEF